MSGGGVDAIITRGATVSSHTKVGSTPKDPVVLQV